MDNQEYWIIIDEAVPINSLHNNDIYCTRCNKLFTREMNVKKGTASYYRCKECLTLTTTIKDALYSCIIM